MESRKAYPITNNLLLPARGTLYQDHTRNLGLQYWQLFRLRCHEGRDGNSNHKVQGAACPNQGLGFSFSLNGFREIPPVHFLDTNHKLNPNCKTNYQASPCTLQIVVYGPHLGYIEGRWKVPVHTLRRT